MRYLGIDYGTKKSGLALSDDTGTMAFPREVIATDSEFLTRIEQLINEEKIDAVVIGHSMHTDGTDNPVQADIEVFITDLTLACGIPIHLQPEQYSTQEAKRYQGKTDKTDAAAAAIILNNFLQTKPLPDKDFDHE